MYQQYILPYFKQAEAEQCQADSKMPCENKWEKNSILGSKLEFREGFKKKKD